MPWNHASHGHSSSWNSQPWDQGRVGMDGLIDFRNKISDSEPLPLRTTQLSCLSMSFVLFSFSGSESGSPLELDFFSAFCLTLVGAHPPCLGGKLSVIKIRRLFFYFLPPSHPLSFGGVKRSSLFSPHPQILLLITFQMLSRIDFHSYSRGRFFFVCLRQRVSWSQKPCFPKWL